MSLVRNSARSGKRPILTGRRAAAVEPISRTGSHAGRSVFPCQPAGDGLDDVKPYRLLHNSHLSGTAYRGSWAPPATDFTAVNGAMQVRRRPFETSLQSPSGRPW